MIIERKRACEICRADGKTAGYEETLHRYALIDNTVDCEFCGKPFQRGIVVLRHVAEPPPSCGGCRFWEVYDGIEGFCRRYPPAVNLGTIHEDDFISRPQVLSHEWCGEFQPKQDA